MFPVGAARLYALRLVRWLGSSRRVAFPVLCCSQERMFALGFVLRATERPLSPRAPLHWQLWRVSCKWPKLSVFISSIRCCCRFRLAVFSRTVWRAACRLCSCNRICPSSSLWRSRTRVICVAYLQSLAGFQNFHLSSDLVLFCLQCLDTRFSTRRAPVQLASAHF